MDINVVLNQAAALKKERDESGHGEVTEENEYRNLYPILVDAFVALGGNADKSGVVRKAALI